LDTGGWLALTRQGLSPCKIRQASLGAITTKPVTRPASMLGDGDDLHGTLMHAIKGYAVYAAILVKYRLEAHSCSERSCPTQRLV
ncbi:MAG: hypothetical protein ACREYF_23975, partial [Gammaproteobacteria bacterium]